MQTPEQLPTEAVKRVLGPSEIESVDVGNLTKVFYKSGRS